MPAHRRLRLPHSTSSTPVPKESSQWGPLPREAEFCSAQPGEAATWDTVPGHWLAPQPRHASLLHLGGRATRGPGARPSLPFGKQTSRWEWPRVPSAVLSLQKVPRAEGILENVQELSSQGHTDTGAPGLHPQAVTSASNVQGWAPEAKLSELAGRLPGSSVQGRS